MSTLFTEDFETTLAALQAKYGASYNNPAPFTSNAPQKWVSDQKYAGTYSLKQSYSGSQYATPPQGGGHVEFDFADQTQPDIWITWYHRFAPGFKTGGDESDARLFGSVATKGLYMYMKSLSTGVVHGWVFHYFYGGRQLTMSAQGIKDCRGPASANYEPRPYDTENMWHNVQGWTQPTGDWICYEANYKLNTPGQANGQYLLYATNMTLGGPTMLLSSYTNREFLDTTPGGLSPSDSRWFRFKFYRQDGLGDMWYDNCSVTTTRLGASGTPPPPDPPSSDTTPPPIPSAPTITSGTSLPLTAVWTGVANPGDLAGYNYYRKLTACDSTAPTLIATLGNVLTYTDTTIPNDTTNVCIAIASRDTSGNVSSLSNHTGGALVPPAASVRNTLATDNFNRANNSDMGSSWDAGYTSRGSLQISSNGCIGSTTGQELQETYNALTLDNDQWASVKITHIAANGAGGVLLRWANAPTLSGYFFKARPDNPSSRIDKLTAGSFTTVGSNNSVTWAVGDTLIAEAEGTTLRLFRTDVSTGVTTKLLEVTDSTHTGGKAGIDMYCVSANNDFGVDDFAVGDFSVGTPTEDTFAHMATLVSDSTGADLTFTGLAHKIRYWNDLHPVTPIEVTGLGGVSTYRLEKTWEPEITFVCIEAQGSDGIWETNIDPGSYICTGVVPGVTDSTAPDAPTGLEFF